MKSNLSLIRRLLREISRSSRLSAAQRNTERNPVVTYVMNTARSHQVLTGKHCKDVHYVEYMAVNYLTMLRALKSKRELLALYGGRGERSTEQSAAMVGLKVPERK